MVSVFFLACLFVIGTVQYSGASKVLIYDLKFQRSHVQFANEIADILVEEGYEVIMLSNILDERLADVGTKRVRRIVVPQVEQVALLGGGRMNDTAWTTYGFTDWFTKVNFLTVGKMFYYQCASIIDNRELIQQLKAEKFDVGLVATLDPCGGRIVHAIGLDNFAFFDLHSSLPFSFHYTSVPQSFSYVPGRFARKLDTEMTSLSNRMSNFVRQMFIELWASYWGGVNNDMIAERFPHLHSNAFEIAANASYIFLNRDPQIDFPTLTTHRIVDVGGMTMIATNKTLDEALGNSADMPDHYKRSLLETFRAFPNVTFVWKYEKPDHNISRGMDNVVESQWLPQKEILRDHRLSAFITQCGISSTFETMHAGVPIIAIPTISDQYRNALMFKRNGGGIVMDKEDLGKAKKMIAAVREILYNKEHTDSARRVASRLASSPISGKENFLRHFEFLVKFGPLHHLKHVGTTQSFIQYYSIDVIAIIAVVLLSVVSAMLGTCYFVFTRVASIRIVKKTKSD